jgi:hypothetical protein
LDDGLPAVGTVALLEELVGLLLEGGFVSLDCVPLD